MSAGRWRTRAELGGLLLAQQARYEAVLRQRARFLRKDTSRLTLTPSFPCLCQTTLLVGTFPPPLA